MKLTYWCARQEADSPCYNIRARTKKECLAIVANDWQSHIYSIPFKVTVDYADAFDLLGRCLGGGIYEYSAEETAAAIKLHEAHKNSGN